MDNSTQPVAGSSTNFLVSQQGISHQRRLLDSSNHNLQSDSTVIDDTLETSDRESDGRRPINVEMQNPGEHDNLCGENLDLQG